MGNNWDAQLAAILTLLFTFNIPKVKMKTRNTVS